MFVFDTNASWTLKADLISNYVCRLLDYMDARGFSRCTPRDTDPTMQRLPPVDFSSGYFQRAMDELPRQDRRSRGGSTRTTFATSGTYASPLSMIVLLEFA